MAIKSSLCFPAPGSAARKNQPVCLDRQPDLIGIHPSPENRHDSGMDHIGQYGGLKPGGIRVDQIKNGIWG